MSLTHNERLGLTPLVALSVVYWVRDKYIFNRAGTKWYRSSTVQLVVLLFVNPLWVFFGWMLSLQTNRNDVVEAFLTTTAQHIMGHYSTVGMLNDSFAMTFQQFIGFFLGLLISYIWTTFWIVVTYTSSSEEADEVHNVEGQHCHCE